MAKKTAANGNGSDLIIVNSLYTKILGNNGGDTFIGTSGAETMTGGNGNDRFNLHGGDDIIFGGKGLDTMIAHSTPLFFLFYQLNGSTGQFLSPQGSLVTYQHVETLEFKFPQSLSYPGGLDGMHTYTIDLTGSIDNTPYVADLGLQTTGEDINYHLDLKTISWDYESNLVWNNGANNISNQPLTFTMTAMHFDEIDAVRARGVVDVDSNGILTYDPNCNVSH